MCGPPAAQIGAAERQARAEGGVVGRDTARDPGAVTGTQPSNAIPTETRDAGDYRFEASGAARL